MNFNTINLLEDIKTLKPASDYAKNRLTMSEAEIETFAKDRLGQLELHYNYSAYQLSPLSVATEQALNYHKLSVLASYKGNEGVSVEDYLGQHKFTAFNAYNTYKQTHPNFSAERYLIEYQFDVAMATCTDQEIMTVVQLAENEQSYNVATRIALFVFSAIEVLVSNWEISFMMVGGCGCIFIPLGFKKCVEESTTFRQIRQIFDQNVRSITTFLFSLVFKNFNYKLVADIALIFNLVALAKLFMNQIYHMTTPDGNEKQALEKQINKWRFLSYSSAILSQREILSSLVSCEVATLVLKIFLEIIENKDVTHTQLANIRDCRLQYGYEHAKELWIQRMLTPA